MGYGEVRMHADKATFETYVRLLDAARARSMMLVIALRFSPTLGAVKSIASGIA